MDVIGTFAKKALDNSLPAFDIQYEEASGHARFMHCIRMQLGNATGILGTVASQELGFYVPDLYMYLYAIIQDSVVHLTVEFFNMLGKSRTFVERHQVKLLNIEAETAKFREALLTYYKQLPVRALEQHDKDKMDILAYQKTIDEKAPKRDMWKEIGHVYPRSPITLADKVRMLCGFTTLGKLIQSYLEKKHELLLVEKAKSNYMWSVVEQILNPSKKVTSWKLKMLKALDGIFETQNARSVILVFAYGGTIERARLKIADIRYGIVNSLAIDESIAERCVLTPDLYNKFVQTHHRVTYADIKSMEYKGKEIYNAMEV